MPGYVSDEYLCRQDQLQSSLARRVWSPEGYGIEPCDVGCGEQVGRTVLAPDKLPLLHHEWSGHSIVCGVFALGFCVHGESCWEIDPEQSRHLTPIAREMGILALVAKVKSNPEIGGDLY